MQVSVWKITKMHTTWFIWQNYLRILSIKVFSSKLHFFLLFLEQVQLKKTNHLGTTSFDFGEAKKKFKHDYVVWYCPRNSQPNFHNLDTILGKGVVFFVIISNRGWIKWHLHSSIFEGIWKLERNNWLYWILYWKAYPDLKSKVDIQYL